MVLLRIYAEPMLLQHGIEYLWYMQGIPVCMVHDVFYVNHIFLLLLLNVWMALPWFYIVTYHARNSMQSGYHKVYHGVLAS